MYTFSIIVQSASVSFVYCLVCFILHFLFNQISINLIPNFKSLNEKSRRMWYNRGVSTMHASLLFAITVNYWIYLNPSLKISNLHTSTEAFCLDIMMGYLWYDIVIEFSSTKQVDTLGHHFLGLISHLSTRISDNDAARFYRYHIYITILTSTCTNKLVC